MLRLALALSLCGPPEAGIERDVSSVDAPAAESSPSDAPEDDVPEGAVPEGAVPEDAVPEDAVPNADAPPPDGVETDAVAPEPTETVELPQPATETAGPEPASTETAEPAPVSMETEPTSAVVEQELAPAETPAPVLDKSASAAATAAPRRPALQRCLAHTTPCYRTTSIRLMLGGIGLLTTVGSLAAVYQASDRQGLGDPWPSVAAMGTVAMSAAVLGGLAGLARIDGPAIPDRLTPATIGVGVALGGSDVSDERVPYSMSTTLAPTVEFPRDLGRVRLLATFGGTLGSNLARDPRPQTASDDGTFVPALQRSGWNFQGGVDLAFRLPYPIRNESLGRLELRYKPLFFYAREQLYFASSFDAATDEPQGEPTISERVALTPLNFGLRWNLSPRQRFTVYMGPRWDLNNYGPRGEVVASKPNVAPIYTEAWFDIDLPLQTEREGRRARIVGQFTLGYIHSRFEGGGLDIGAIVGFLGPVVAQFGFRVRPIGSPVAYQFELGARVGGGLSPFLRAGIVLPTLGGKS